jgi:hypothetical protein
MEDKVNKTNSNRKLKALMNILWKMDENDYPIEDLNNLYNIIDSIRSISNKPEWFYDEGLEFIKKTGGNGPFNDYMVDYLIERGIRKEKAVDIIADLMFDREGNEYVAIFIYGWLGYDEGKKIIIEKIDNGYEEYKDVLDYFNIIEYYTHRQ